MTKQSKEGLAKLLDQASAKLQQEGSGRFDRRIKKRKIQQKRRLGFTPEDLYMDKIINRENYPAKFFK